MIEFFKYEGTGNDFIIIDSIQVHPNFKITYEQVKELCNRHTGIGADGLIILAPSEDYDFKMIYYNADGNISSMCGNGGRCIASFARRQGYIHEACSFEAADGAHTAVFPGKNLVKLSMNDVSAVNESGTHSVLNTGSPHYIIWFDSDIDNIDMLALGRSIRYNETYKQEGINVNAVEVKSNNELKIRTYERGVEDETLSCGTGVTAAALAHANRLLEKSRSSTLLDSELIHVDTKGGNLKVHYMYKSGYFTNIWLEGPARLIFRGYVKLKE